LEKNGEKKIELKRILTEGELEKEGNSQEIIRNLAYSHDFLQKIFLFIEKDIQKNKKN